MEPAVGQKLVSQVDSTTLVVVRAPARPVTITCGGVAVVDAKDVLIQQQAEAAAVPGATSLGKRYANEELGLEVLCTKGGDHLLAVDGVPLGLKVSKPLPASD